MEFSEGRFPSYYTIFKSTLSGGIIINLIFNPFDVVKNYWFFNRSLSKCRTQITSLDVAKHIYKTGGISSFWKGMFILVSTYLGVFWATPLTVFGHSLFLFTYDSIKNDVPPPVASLISRIVTLFPCQPIDCMRTYAQSTLNTTGKESFFSIVKKNGFLSLYKGTYSTLIRDIPFSAIHWPINEFFYQKISNFEIYKKRKMTHFETVAIPFACGTFSSLIATFVSQPFDIIKTNLQSTGVDLEEAKTHRTASGKLNMFTELMRIKRSYGIRGLFIGVTPRIIKVVPGSAIMSATYHFFN